MSTRKASTADAGAQILRRNVIGHQQPDPIKRFRSRRFLFQPLLFADFIELSRRRGDRFLLDAGIMNVDNSGQRPGLGKTDLVKEATA